MYLLRTSEHKSTSCSVKKYQIALDSGATTHVMNASSLDGKIQLTTHTAGVKSIIFRIFVESLLFLAILSCLLLGIYDALLSCAPFV